MSRFDSRSTPDPYRPIALPCGDAKGRRPSGPLRGTNDPWVERRAGHVSRAWDLARRRYVHAFIAQATSESFAQTLRELVDVTLMDLDLIDDANAGDLGALGAGRHGIPGAGVGLGTGYSFGLRLLAALEAGFLARGIIRELGKVETDLRLAVAEAWNSEGSDLRIDGSARRMAEAVGDLFTLLLETLVAHLTRELAGPARGRLRPVLSKIQDSALFQDSKGLNAYLLRHYDRLRSQFTAQPERITNLAIGGRGTARLQPSLPLPDVSHLYQFRSEVREGKTYKHASGPLGVPGRVKTHRSRSAQASVSSGTGDDAGHLIGDRFGAPGGPENLSTQNWVANRYGTYKNLEDEWAAKLLQGIDIHVTVTDITKKDEDRPFVREVKWTELTPEDLSTTHALTFGNFHTPKSREARGIEPTVDGPQKDNVIEVDFQNKSQSS